MRLSMPKVVAFDVIDTLFSIDAFKPLFQTLGLSESALYLWLSRIARDGACLSLADTYRTYEQVARAALLQVASSEGKSISSEDLCELMRGFKTLKPYPDVYSSLKTLKEKGIRLVMLTNTSAELTNHLLVVNDLDKFVHRIISNDEVRVWKPCQAVYEHASRLLAVAPSEMAMVAAHAWDIHGAKAAGLIGAWVSTSEKTYGQSFLAPDFTADSIKQVAANLVQQQTIVPTPAEISISQKIA